MIPLVPPTRPRADPPRAARAAALRRPRTQAPGRFSHARARRLVAALYAYAFLDDFVLLYPLYALLFTDAGLTPVQVSALFVIWSLTGLTLEVPSGALADAVSRRALLVVAPLLGATGYGLWVAVPSFWAFAAGFILWGVRGALASGSLEALVYEEDRKSVV